MESIEKLLALVPDAPDWTISWEEIEKSSLNAVIRAMADTPQNPVYHGEGDVWTHTKLVCRALVALDAYRQQDRTGRQLLFLAALLHDVGKTVCTRWEDDRWTSPNHAPVGARMARQMLWRQYDLAGTPEKQAFREAVCGLIRYHGMPPYALEEPDGHRRLRRIAANGELTSHFTLERLCILSEADALGRLCADRDDMADRVRLCRELAEEAGCLTAPYPFPSEHTRFMYLSGRNISPEVPLYDDSWGPVILMCGLPGTGKDTWIRSNCPDIPMVSLDEIRREIGAAPVGDQTRVVEIAKNRSREYLRNKQPFVWNATNISPMIRRKQLSLFEEYHAAVRIVYLETPWDERVRRNRGRTPDRIVPDAAVCGMLEELVLPERFEAHRIDWYCI